MRPKASPDTGREWLWCTMVRPWPVMNPWNAWKQQKRKRNSVQLKKRKERSPSRKREGEQCKEKQWRCCWDEDHQVCEAEFQEGEEETCLGCNRCWRWVHCYCVGLDVPPEEDTLWFCADCSDVWTLSNHYHTSHIPHNVIIYIHKHTTE